MRILRVSYRTPPEPGGKERHVACLTREQARLGHEVTVAFRHGAAPDGSAARLAPPPTAVSRALGARSDVLAFAAEVAAALGRGRARFDLVHLHGDHVEAAPLARACRRAGTPLVLTVHGALADRYVRYARWGLRGVAAFLALGSRTARDLVARGVPPGRITVMSSGLDLAELAAVPGPAVPEPGLIVSAGALDPVKNHGLLIEAVRVLRRDRPGIRLVIAGGGAEHARLRALAGPGVELPGPLPRPELLRLVRSAEVFVLASRRLPGKGEGVPTAALEALALGTPVVLSREASLEPVVPPGDVYRVFAPDSLDDLVGVLGEVLGDQRVRRRMAALGPPAVAGLDWPLVAARVEACYRAVLDPRHRARDLAARGGAR